MKKANLKFSRLLCIALCMLLSLTAVIPAFAVGPTDQDNLKVTIRNNEGLPKMTKDQFSVYQIFKGSPNKDENIKPEDDPTNEWDALNWNNYSLADIEWGDSMTADVDVVKALKNALKTADWATIDEKNVFAEWADKKDPEGTAAELAAILVGKDNEFMQHFANTVVSIPGIETVELPNPGTNPVVYNAKGDDDEDDPSQDYLTYTLSDPGYYLFAETANDDAAVSEYMLAVVGEQDILLKASVPTVDKEIVDGNHGTEGDAAGVSDVVTFKLTGTLPKNFGDFKEYYYLFTDRMSKGLSLKTDSFEVTVKKGDKLYTIDASEYAVLPTGVLKDPPGEDTTIMVMFSDLIKGAAAPNGLKYTKVDPDDADAAGDEVELNSTCEIYVTYKATVNTDAVIGSTGNPNTVSLTYSNDPNSDSHGKTEEKTVRVYAFGLDLTKVGSDSEHASGLGGAGFVLKDEDGNYAIFKDQYTNVAGNAFSDTKTGDFTVGPVRRLTGWTSTDSEPDTTEDVSKKIENYKTAKANFDKASTADQQNEDSEVSKALKNAKEALAAYLLESAEGTGKIPDVYGLDEGKYNLQEVITPAGYNTMDDFDIKIEATIDESTGDLTKVTYTHGEETVTYLGKTDEYTTEVLPRETANRDEVINDRIARFESGLLADELENQKAPFLPFTGGMGTLIFYVLGTALIAGAVAYLVIVSKKRKKAE